MSVHAGQLWSLISTSEEQTEALGRVLADRCRGGELLLLEGPMGAGKTTLTRGLGAGLDVREPTVSPTYILMRSYAARDGLTLHHLDLYRLGAPEEIDTIGIEDVLAEDAVVVVEWPERSPADLAAFSLRLRIELIDDATRRFHAEPGPTLTAELAAPPEAGSARA